jgi:hypothetical protein
VQAVGADGQVELANPAVVEADPHRPLQPLHARDGAAGVHGHAVAQDPVQVGAGQGQAAHLLAPQLAQVDVGEHPPAVVQQPLAGDGDRPGGDLVLQAQGAQRAHAVVRQVHAGPGSLEGGLPFDHLRGEPGPAQRSRQRQPGDPRPDDQDPCLVHAVLSVRPRPSPSRLADFFMTSWLHMRTAR